MQSVTNEQATHILKNRKLLHAALVQKDYDIPALSSPLSSHDFLIGVY